MTQELKIIEAIIEGAREKLPGGFTFDYETMGSVEAPRSVKLMCVCRLEGRVGLYQAVVDLTDPRFSFAVENTLDRLYRAARQQTMRELLHAAHRAGYGGVLARRTDDSHSGGASLISCSGLSAATR